MKSVAAIIDWYGPYTMEEAQRAAADYADGIYLALGKAKNQRYSLPQYVGVASDLKKRLGSCHHKLPLITRDLTIWLGEVVSPRIPGRKVKVTDRMLDLSEWAHAYFLQLPLNGQKRATPPDGSVIVYNRWWKKDLETPYKRRPHESWPDVIDYLGREYNYDAKLIWFGGHQIVQPVDAFRC